MSGRNDRVSESGLVVGRRVRKQSFAEIIGQSAAIRTAIEKARRCVRSASPLCIEGETGTGKEVFTRAIHAEGPRRDQPLVAVNCGAIPADLFEREFFGNERGAYTGADCARAGFFEQADGGILFLDEINSLPLSCQAKLLRAVEQGECCRLGGTAPRQFDVRIICASNRDLKQEVLAGRLREDLYHRLACLELKLPPLREHRADIPLLANERLQFLISETPASVDDQAAPDSPAILTPAALKKMMDYDWPGNVRELEGKVEQAFLDRTGLQIQAADLRFEAGPPTPVEETLLSQAERVAREFLRGKLAQILRECRGNRSRSARRAGMDRRTLYTHMRKLGLDCDDFTGSAA